MDTRLPLLALCAGTTLTTSIALAGPIYERDFETSRGDEAGVWSDLTRSNLGGPYTRFLGRYSNRSVSLRLNATAANTAGLGGGVGDPGDQGDGGGGGGPRPFNLTSKPVNRDRIPIPLPDSSGGGGGGNPGGGGPYDHNGPSLNLGGALNNGGGSSGGEPPSDGPVFTQGTYALTFDLMLFDSWDADNVGFGPDSFSVNINGETAFHELLEVHALENNFRMPDELPTLNAYSPTWQDQIYRDITIYFEVASAMDHFDFEFIGTLDQSIADESWGIDNIRINAIDPVSPLSVPSVPAPGALSLLGLGLGLMGRRSR